ncbi:hypothetical protein KSP40_PGU002749 [Platanthera guangdongensis]|uniref:Uncharacterized protein n=1 Tax=Platanthera guangdongensis TaxID=2320717 RepID=A0ABR2LQ91_9ASPA
MENSAKRKERLQAMRMEASSSSTDRPSPSFSTPNMPLSNPLIYPSVPSMESQLSLHRFDYYTDPTAAYFSAGGNMNRKGEDARHDSYHHPPIFSSPIHKTSPLSYTAAQQQFGNFSLDEAVKAKIKTKKVKTLRDSLLAKGVVANEDTT